jgi:EAL domain-containing protein (putative c-di-GMP-specific phosphodiesterase class I)
MLHFDPRRERAANARRMRPGTIDATRVVPVSEGLIEADHSFEVRAVSPMAAKLLGWDHPATLTRALNETGWWPFGAELRREMQFGLALRGRWQGPARLRRRDGSELQSFVTACALNASPGTPSGVVVAIRASNAIHERAFGASQGDAFAVSGLPGHFCLFYQPEIDLTDGSVTGCEALLRWWHPGLGMISPGPALADRRWAARLTGVEVWSVFAACRQAMAWAEQGNPVPVVLNLSPTHLQDPEVVDRIRRAITVTGLHPSDLTVDLPGEAVGTTPQRLRLVAWALHDLGVTVAIDDAGRGHMPDALREFPAQVLKLSPGAGQRGPAGPVPGAATIAVAKAMGATTVAKGVETTLELANLRDLGCDRAFGHLFVPPMPPTDLAGLLWPAPERVDLRREAPVARPQPVAAPMHAPVPAPASAPVRVSAGLPA